jgi:hypothetical protein
MDTTSAQNAIIETITPENSSSRSRSLKDLLIDLPQELYDEIYDITMTYDHTPAVIEVTRTTKPPAIMQVNHTVRKTVAES